MRARVAISSAVVVATLASAGRAHADHASDEAPPDRAALTAPPDESYAPTTPSMAPGLVWLVGTVLPSPAIAFADAAKPSFGLRWQVTPALWSWGVHRATSRWRFFVVDPLARVSGSIELTANLDWFFGAVDTSLLRPGIRATVPLLHRGEYLAASFGTSLYDRNGTRVAYDAGLWTFSGFAGVTATVAPGDDALRAIATFHLRVMH